MYPVVLLAGAGALWVYVSKAKQQLKKAPVDPEVVAKPSLKAMTQKQLAPVPRGELLKIPVLNRRVGEILIAGEEERPDAEIEFLDDMPRAGHNFRGQARAIAETAAALSKTNRRAVEPFPYGQYGVY